MYPFTDDFPIVFQNVAPNHRANDMIVLEDKAQILTARFMYGPLDMVSLSGEKVETYFTDYHPDYCKSTNFHYCFIFTIFANVTNSLS